MELQCFRYALKTRAVKQTTTRLQVNTARLLPQNGSFASVKWMRKGKKYILLRKPADVAQNWSGSWEENHFKTMAVTQRHVHVVKSIVNNHLLIRVIIEYLWPAKRWMGLIWMNFTNQNKTPWWSCLWDPQVSQWSFLLRCQLFFRFVIFSLFS